ncbi:MAG: hypothetical protein Q8P13_01915 [bacterium]|nr:hypothetical protein [bacterium]
MKGSCTPRRGRIVSKISVELQTVDLGHGDVRPIPAEFVVKAFRAAHLCQHQWLGKFADFLEAIKIHWGTHSTEVQFTFYFKGAVAGGGKTEIEVGWNRAGCFINENYINDWPYRKVVWERDTPLDLSSLLALLVKRALRQAFEERVQKGNDSLEIVETIPVTDWTPSNP